MPSECLLHLIRQERRKGEGKLTNTLLPILLKRCEKILYNKPKLRNNESLIEEILQNFAELIVQDGINKEQNDLDFYEIRFNSAFQWFWFNQYKKERKNFESTISLHEDNTGDESSINNSDMLEKLSTLSEQEGHMDTRELRDAIDSLPPNERRAVVLHYMMEYKIESKDPNVKTVATICNTTGRTIRNHLKQAYTILKKTLQQG